MIEQFIEKRFAAKSKLLIEQGIVIINEYTAQGFSLTLRQLYYQFVARGFLENTHKNYKRLGSVINDARLAGLIDWRAIEDRTRHVREEPSWDSPQSIVNAISEQYQEDLWANQDYRPEVWIEKDALIGVIEPACQRWRVPYFACRGYSSQSEQYAAGKRFEGHMASQQIPIVLHLGDHDPSGIDMSRDNTDRLAMFAYQDVELRRLALNFDQVKHYKPPPNPAKEKDSRAAGYVKRFGKKSWELDALDPPVIDKLIDNEIRSLVNPKRWAAAKAREKEQRELLVAVSDNWDSVKTLIKDMEE